MKHFVEQINDKNPEMYDCVNKNYRVFCALNKLHMSDNIYRRFFIPLLHVIRH